MGEINSIDQLTDDEVSAIAERLKGPERGRHDDNGTDPGLTLSEAIVAVIGECALVNNLRTAREELHARQQQPTTPDQHSEADAIPVPPAPQNLNDRVEMARYDTAMQKYLTLTTAIRAREADKWRRTRKPT